MSERDARAPKTTHRADYRPPDYIVRHLSLDFDLEERATLVHARMEIERRASAEIKD